MYEIEVNDNVNFLTIKEKIKDFYIPLDFNNIKIDREDLFFIKNDKENSYVQLKEDNKKLYIELFKAKKANFIEELINKSSDNNDFDNDKTKKLLEIKDMLEKDLITKDEFDELKAEVLK